MLLLAACASLPPPVPAGDARAELSSLRGKVVLVDFFASWCEPCRRSLPFYGELRRRHAEGFEILAVSVDQDGEQLARFLSRVGPLPFPVVRDPSGSLAEQFRVGRMPTCVLLDRDGAEVFREGGYDPDSVAAAVARAMR